MFRKNKYKDNHPNIHEMKKRNHRRMMIVFGILAFVLLNAVFYLLTSY